MMAMRWFDQKYAPLTVLPTNEDPGALALNGGGTMFGVLYAWWRGRGRKRSALADGAILGAIVYAIGQVAWLPLCGLAKPMWKQTFPQIGGGLLRHLAYGVATVVVFGRIDELV
jgi:hypothetical protein